MPNMVFLLDCFCFPIPSKSSQATLPVPSSLGSDFYPEGPMFCTNSYTISFSTYFVIGGKLVNARPAKSFGKKRMGLFKCRSKRNAWAEA